MKATLICLFAYVAISSAAPKLAQPILMRNLFKDSFVPIREAPGQRIIGGEEVKPHSIPYQAFLEIRNEEGGWYCGGSLISRSYVLTAGHCSQEDTIAKTATVTLGAHDVTAKESTQLKVIATKFIVHPKFDIGEIINDISIIQLDTPVELSDLINVVKLPTDSSVTYAGEIARVSGWGLTKGGNPQLSNVLRSTSNPILTNLECLAQFFRFIPDTQICLSGSGGHGSCNGDSGGPLVIKDVQIGVVSYGLNFCPAGFPSAFTRVTSYLDWIAENTDLNKN